MYSTLKNVAIFEYRYENEHVPLAVEKIGWQNSFLC